MNQQIFDLAQQASGTKKYIPPVWQFFDYELEKFAELIILECCDQVRYVDALEIKNHFGME